MNKLFNIKVAQKKPEKPMPFLDFSINYNRKLNCSMFTAIKPIFIKYNINERVYVRIKGQFYCYATIIKKEIKTLQEIIESGIFLVDVGLRKHDFLELIKKEYSNKKWWKEEQTEFNVYFLEKYVQMELF